MRGLRFNEGDMDRANEFPGSEVEKPETRAIIAISNEYAPERFGGQFVHVAILQAEVDCAAEDLNVCEVSRDTMKNGVGNTARPCERSGRG
jgi:hypothetical protein